MNSLSRKVILGLAAAAAIVAITGGSVLAQQNVDAIRQQCMEKALRESPSQGPDKSNRAALEIYQTCMRSNGLQP
jgi:hypothetical protein